MDAGGEPRFSELTQARARPRAWSQGPAYYTVIRPPSHRTPKSDGSFGGRHGHGHRGTS